MVSMLLAAELQPTSASSFSKKRSSAGFCARGRTTVRLVVRGEKATVPWDSISFWASLMRSLSPLCTKGQIFLHSLYVLLRMPRQP